MSRDKKENVTISIGKDVPKKARLLAAERNTSVAEFLVQAVERFVDQEETYESSRRKALALLDQGFHLGGKIRASRDELHERREWQKYNENQRSPRGH